MDNPPNLTADEILKAEFNYITQTAFQANEDRGKITNFYFVVAGSLIVSALTAQSDNAALFLLFGVLFLTLSITGLLTLLQMMRLREAWFDSALAMNRIKAFYFAHVKELPLSDAFMWKVDNLPDVYKPWSVTFLQIAQIAVLGAATLAAAVIFIGRYFNTALMGPALIAGAAFLIGQMSFHHAQMTAAEARVQEKIKEINALFESDPGKPARPRKKVERKS
jgi:hypothetical protein